MNADGRRSISSRLKAAGTWPAALVCAGMRLRSFLGCAFLCSCAFGSGFAFGARFGGADTLGVDQVESVFSVEWELADRSLTGCAQSDIHTAALRQRQNTGFGSELLLLRRSQVGVLINGLLDLVNAHGLFFTEALGLDCIG